MGSYAPSQMSSPSINVTEEEKPEPPMSTADFKETLSTLPKVKDWTGLDYIYEYEGFWHHEYFLEGIISAQQHYKPQPSDIVLSSVPKSGTTWLKALAFSIATRHCYDDFTTTSLLLTKVPHKCVPRLEVDLVASPSHYDQKNKREVPLVATHVPFTSLPKSLIDSDCKIVYICRDPKDAFVSMWHFFHNIFSPKGVEILPLEEAFEEFCKGLVFCGPYWDHVLGYWKASLELPGRILFLKYEEMKRDTEGQVKILAEFMGFPFSAEEVKDGVVEKIIKMCSFECLSSLEVNKNGKNGEDTPFPVKNNVYFRKGDVGDWKNHLTSEMAKRLDSISDYKFSGSGLNLKSYG
ncbi:flavonol 3-sulfotransferase-like [Tripterygium wilfordii]|uniref:flavonol 3-sulfotransferase-like n=1 Tax=Tripterygium wilfordii TaxID=458696 RepID=UPI0018F82272|nr:flavonol 3-sulfotransferase-like [Tripterygium wilfordii]